MKLFNVLTAPLEGSHLIEAGAGTGKTYSIASVFLRLILERELSVDKILVLTYTRAATMELKERIRTKLWEMKQLLDTDADNADDLYKHLRKKAQAENLCTKWSLLLESALADFDSANIHNFHQFCQKVIKDYAVETGGLFDAEILPDNAAFMEQAADDFWRQSVYHAEPLLAGYLADKLKPKTLVDMTRVIIGFNTCDKLNDLLPPLKDFDFDYLNRQIKTLNSLFREIKNTWLLNRDEIVRFLSLDYLNGTYYKKDRLAAMPDEMDNFTDALLPYPLPRNYEKWQLDYMQSKPKKGCPTPNHRFFELWQAMGETYAVFETKVEKHIHNLKVEAASYIQTEMEVQKRLQNKLDFNDLIAMVGRTVLQNSDDTLCRQLKSSYQAVMVDEFQDTDSLQYKMFSSLFANAEHLFFMIGDPKQAIYAFRGADVFSYFAASKNTRSRFNLPTNWRSVRNLVHGVNQVFKNHPDAPFVVNDISFEGAVANAAKTTAFEDAPLIFWYLDSRCEAIGGRLQKDDFILNNEAAAKASVKAAGQEILRLLNDKSKGLNPKDIAVLVNNNHQGREVYHALEDLRIPATLSANNGVFQSQEARELLLILESAAQPENMQKLRAAYTTTIFGGEAKEYLSETANEDLWLQRSQKMRDWYKIFSERGVLSMFLNMIFAENSFGRLLSAPDGRRKVTNFEHLAELLHESAQSLNLTLMGLTRFLRKAMRNKENSEETGLRLETDNDVVQIITVHKSKGLEYEIVFYPFAWDGVRGKNVDVYKYHRQNNIHLGFEENLPGFKEYLRESLAEKLRLLYVALTRARQRCYVTYGRVKTSANGINDKFETAALTYLLLGQGLNSADPNLAISMQDEFKKPEYDDVAIRQTLDALAARTPNCIQVHDLPLGGGQAYYQQPVDKAVVLRKIDRGINTNWKVTSFSSLTQITGTVADVFEGRDLEQNIENDVEPVEHREADMPEPFSIFSLPKGAHVGNFFHDLLENADFAATALRPSPELILTKLAEYNLDERFAPAITQLLINLCNANLAKSQGIVTLKNVCGFLKEMEFYFPLNAITQEKMRELFARNDIGALPESFAKQGGRFIFAPAEGYLKGFIDLTFCYNNRYYILDWKSNYEGACTGDYNPDKLLHSVAKHSYFLQYYLYTLALCQYLRLRLPEFKYGRDFGGVFYVFLRGFADAQNEADDFGVFRDHPPLKLINALGHLLVNRFDDFEE